MPAAQLIMPLLGAAFGDQAPIQDPNAWTTDENGNPVLKSGMNPYKQSGFMTRWLHPDVARETGELNSEQGQQVLRNLIANNIAAQNTHQVMSDVNKPFGQKSDLSLALSSDRNPANLPSVERTSAEHQIGLPMTEALARQSQAAFTPEQIASQRKLLGPQTSTELERLGVESNSLENQLRHKEDLSSIFGMGVRKSLADVATDQALSEARYEMTPELQDTLRNQIRTGRLESNFVQPQGSPFVGQWDTDGRLNLGQPNPLFGSLFGPLNAYMQGTGMGAQGGAGISPSGKPITLEGGAQLPMKPRVMSEKGEYLNNIRPQGARVPINPNIGGMQGGGQREENKQSVSSGYINYLKSLFNVPKTAYKNTTAAIDYAKHPAKITQSLADGIINAVGLGNKSFDLNIGGVPFSHISQKDISDALLNGKSASGITAHDVMEYIDKLPVETQHKIWTDAMKKNGIKQNANP